MILTNTNFGKNGKSMLSNLLEWTLGDYCNPFECTLLTRPRPASNAAVPEIINFKNKRLCIGSEPEAKSPINSSFYKLLSGKDSILARDLYKGSEVINPTWKLSILCNTIPKFDMNEEAIWDRTRCVKFPTRFVLHPNPKDKNEKKRILGIDAKFKEWAPDFMLLLIEKYNEYLEHGLEETKNVLSFTQEHREAGDYVLEFVKEFIEETNDQKKGLHTKNLLLLFNKWLQEAYPNEKKMSSRDLNSCLRKIYPNSVVTNLIDVTGFGSGFGWGFGGVKLKASETDVKQQKNGKKTDTPKIDIEQFEISDTDSNDASNESDDENNDNGKNVKKWIDV